jgi:hypothetical protein
MTDMQVGDVKYNEHFRQMVLEAVSAGLEHPVEWFTSYDRGIAVSHESLTEISEFCDLAAKELYACSYCIKQKDVTMINVNHWVDKHYKQGKYELRQR